MTAWTWHDTTARPAAHQMAMDEAAIGVLRRHGGALLRLYQWQDDTLSLGANERAGRTWDRAALERVGIPVVRRPSGGRGVWHRRDDLTYAWVGPAGGPAEVRVRYRDLHDRLGAALARCGLATRMAAAPTEPAGLGPGACFDATVGGELVADWGKMVGSAQKVAGDTMLQHGAIALGPGDGAAPFRLDGTATAQSSQQVPTIAAARVAEAILAAWHDDHARPAPAGLIDDLIAAGQAAADRFADPAWTWRR